MKPWQVFGLLCVAAFLCCSWQYAPPQPLRIFLIGDSTMANKPGSATENPERGWGQFLDEFFNSEVSIHNHAVNGRSSESFRTEGRWQVVLDSLREGDYIFIQFGHNDQKKKDPERYTNPWTGYRRNLQNYAEEAQAKGAFPIILSSIVRRKFNDEGTLTDTHGPYPFVAQMVAKDLGIPFIDHQLLSEDLVKSLGPEDSKKLYLWVEAGEYARFPDGKQDDTHLNPDGARAFAGLVASAIKAQQLPLATYLTPNH